jgi:uncharacterized ferritin-like protein (DUF455 family)
MWDEARHIEIVAKVCEDELGAELGYGPWSLVWWWMQNEADPLRRIAVTNTWAEANLMQTLREWRTHAEERGYARIAELCDYLQADELNHVKLATEWIRRLTADDPERRADLVRWGTQAVGRIEGFYADESYEPPGEDEVRFTFLKEGGARASRAHAAVIGE